MGSYTHLRLDVTLSAATPANVTDELQAMVMGRGNGEGRRVYMLNCGSSTHDTDGSHIYRNKNGTWQLTADCSLKNYEGEIDWFCGWIAPYVLDRGVVGFRQFEQDEPVEIVFDVGPDVSPELLRQIERALDAASHSPLEQPFGIDP